MCAYKSPRCLVLRRVAARCLFHHFVRHLSHVLAPGCRVARLPALEPPRCNEQRSRRKPAQAVRRLTLKGAAYENASYRLTKSVGGVSASLSSGIFGVAIPVVPQFLSGLFRPAYTEGGDPALLPPVGIKPNTALATAHQRQHAKQRVCRRLPAAVI